MSEELKPCPCCEHYFQAFAVLTELKKLYEISPDMREPRTETSAKLLIRHSEQAILIAESQRKDSYIKKLLNTRHDPDKELVEALEKIMSYTKLGTGSINKIRGIAGKALAEHKEK